MKNIALFILFLSGLHASAYGQKLIPQKCSVGYYGATIAHPGIKISANYCLKLWETDNKKKKYKSFEFSPQLAFYHHRNYHTAVIALPEINYSRIKESGWYVNYSFGLGYMHTFLPNVFEFNENNQISKTALGYNYFLISAAAMFGYTFDWKRETVLYAGPRLNYALPNFNTGTLSLIFELGISFDIKQSE